MTNINVDYVIATPAQLLELKHHRTLNLELRHTKKGKHRQVDLSGQCHLEVS